MKWHTKCEYKYHPWAYVLYCFDFTQITLRHVPLVPVSHIAGIPMTCTENAMSTRWLHMTWRHIIARLSATSMLTSIVQYTFRVTDIQQTMLWRAQGSATRWFLCNDTARFRRAIRLSPWVAVSASVWWASAYRLLAASRTGLWLC